MSVPSPSQDLNLATISKIWWRSYPEYGKLIRDARENLNLAPEELALRIKEKATLLKKIEREEIVPEDSTRVKLERELHIKLTDKATDAQVKVRSSGKGLTLGDIANIKRRK